MLPMPAVDDDFSVFHAGLVLWGRASRDKELPAALGRAADDGPYAEWTTGVQRIENALVLMRQDWRRQGVKRLDVIKASYIWGMSDHAIGGRYHVGPIVMRLYREESERLAYDCWLHITDKKIFAESPVF